MTEYLKQLASKTSLMTKIAIPIVLLGVIMGFFITQSLAKLLDDYTTKSLKVESRSINNKVYYLVEAEFKALFFSYGRDKQRYEQAKRLSQQELVASLQNLFRESIYDIAVISPKNLIWVKRSYSNSDIIHSIQYNDIRSTYLLDNYIISSSYFKPWGWSIVIVRDRSSVLKLIAQNNRIVTQNISLLIVLIILTLIVILYFTIDRPFGVVFKHLNAIANDRITPLRLSSSKEIVKLVHSINSMSSEILASHTQLSNQKAKIKRIMDIQPDILIVTDGERLQSVNESFFKFFDAYRTLEEFLEQHACVCDFFEEVNEEGYIYHMQNENWVDVVYRQKDLSKVKIQKDNRLYTFKIQVEKFDDTTYVANLNDITQLEEYQAELKAKRDSLMVQLYTDPLTKLPNRIRLIEDIKQTPSPVIILINIDGFKEINDFYGVDIGDLVLIEFAKSIQAHLPSVTSKLYKMSGDEYIILDTLYLPRVELIKRLNLLSTHLNTQTITTHGHQIDISTTMGVAMGYRDLLIRSDVALREAKHSKLRFAIYDKSFETLKQYKDNLLWSKKIKEAIDHKRIVPYFQPIVDNQTHKIVKYESLVRLISPEDKVITPFVFLDIAKQSRIYHNISKIMIENSFRYFATQSIDFSINISINDIENFETHQLILEKLRHYRFGNRVTFEILESEGINNYSVVSSFINEIKKYDAKIAIDDFGTGYSNFSHIINLHVDFLKIDGSLINNMLHDESLRVVVETIVAFAKRLGIKTVAEFVDSKELYEYVCAIGIDYSQGFYISQPKVEILDENYTFYPKSEVDKI